MMKTIDKMTDQEIYDLTDEQVEKLIVIRCAEEGVRFMDEPPIMRTYIFFKKAYGVDDDTERYIREGIKDYPLFNNNID